MRHHLYQGERRPSQCDGRRLEKLLLGKRHGARCKPCMHCYRKRRQRRAKYEGIPLEHKLDWNGVGAREWVVSNFGFSSHYLLESILRRHRFCDSFFRCMLRSAVRRWVRVATTSMRTAALVPSFAQNASALGISWPRRRNTSWQQLFVPTLAESCEEHMQSPRRSDARPLRRNCRGHLVRLEATAASTWEPCTRRMKNISNGTLAWSEVRVRDVSSCPGDASWSVLPRPLLGSCGCARGPPSLGG